jgi:hypothetical protein
MQGKIFRLANQILSSTGKTIKPPKKQDKRKKTKKR